MGNWGCFIPINGVITLLIWIRLFSSMLGTSESNKVSQMVGWLLGDSNTMGSKFEGVQNQQIQVLKSKPTSDIYSDIPSVYMVNEDPDVMAYYNLQQKLGRTSSSSPPCTCTLSCGGSRLGLMPIFVTSFLRGSQPLVQYSPGGQLWLWGHGWGWRLETGCVIFHRSPSRPLKKLGVHERLVFY